MSPVLALVLAVGVLVGMAATFRAAHRSDIPTRRSAMVFSAVLIVAAVVEIVLVAAG